MDELKACPFCGSSNTTLDYYEISGPQELGTIVVCNDCGASAKSIVDWNTRPIEDALRARIAELERQLDEWNDNQWIKDMKAENNAMLARAEKAEAMVERLIEIGDWATIGMVISESYSPSSNMRNLAEDRRNEWKNLVKEWKERE